jgi:hypothetical protein
MHHQGYVARASQISLLSQCAHTQTHITDSTVHSARVRARQFGCKSTLARVHQKKRREREGQSEREREFNKKRARRVRAVRALPTTLTLLPCSLLLVLFITLCLFDSRWHGENKRRQSVRGQIYYALSLRTCTREWRRYYNCLPLHFLCFKEQNDH